MPLVRSLPAWFHAIADYAVAALLIAVPLIAGGKGLAVVTGVVVGIVVRRGQRVHPLPARCRQGAAVHRPLRRGLPRCRPAGHRPVRSRLRRSGLAIFYVVAGIAVLAVSQVTNYQYSPKRAATPAREAQHA